MSGIGKLIARSLEDLEGGRFMLAALAIFSAIDATAKKRFPNEKGVGARFRSFLDEQNLILMYVASGEEIVSNSFSIQGVSVSSAIWRFARNPIVHEAEFDPRMSFENDEGFKIELDSWNLPPLFLLGLVVSVICAYENVEESEQLDGHFKLFGGTTQAKGQWGKEAHMKHLILQRLD